MAGSSSSHEVFISFRGEDTRRTFTSHLNSALRRLSIRTYIDDNLERGDEIPEALVKAIEEAKLSVIVFSKNFANSRWCLDEVVKILECKKNKRQIILPVFYDVEPTNVRGQKGSYAEAFAAHEKRYESKMSMVQKWKDALATIADLSGWDFSINSNKTEAELVEQIAKHVLQKLNHAYVGDLDQEIAKLEQLEQLQQEYNQLVFTNSSREAHKATVQRIMEVKMKRSVRLIRFTPETLSYLEGSDAFDIYL